jgi:hypothetical protein
MGEIKESNRYDTQPRFEGGTYVIDRVNGFRIGDHYTDAAAARAAADEFNLHGLPLASAK